MKIKKLSKIKINSYTFNIKWDKTKRGGWFRYDEKMIEIGTRLSEEEVFETLCHELIEICHCEMYTRFNRGDCDTDYIFVYDHRQHTMIMSMFAGLITQFIGEQ